MDKKVDCIMGWRIERWKTLMNISALHSIKNYFIVYTFGRASIASFMIELRKIPLSLSLSINKLSKRSLPLPRNHFHIARIFQTRTAKFNAPFQIYRLFHLTTSFPSLARKSERRNEGRSDDSIYPAKTIARNGKKEIISRLGWEHGVTRA